jgi:hypothetical protein
VRRSATYPHERPDQTAQLRFHRARSRGHDSPERGRPTCRGKKTASIKNRKQYEGLPKKGMSKERAAKIANTPGASKKGGKKAAAKRKKKS